MRVSSRVVVGAAGVGVLMLGAMALPGTVAAGGGMCHEPPSEAAGTNVRMAGACFVPAVLHVAAGQEVAWQNDSDMPHAVTGVAGAWGDFTQYGAGRGVSRSFASPGVYPYYCFVHNGMIGAIVVSGGEEPAEAVLAVNPSGPAAAEPSGSEVAASTAPATAGRDGWDPARVLGAGAGIAVVGAFLLATRRSWLRRAR
jgi:plastocyanin